MIFRNVYMSVCSYVIKLPNYLNEFSTNSITILRKYLFLVPLREF